MPRLPRSCPALATFLSAILAVGAPIGAQAEDATPVAQRWNAYVFGLKAGELEVTLTERKTTYEGASLFQTTGLAALLRKVRFEVSAKGTIEDAQKLPSTYSGMIHTGRRSSQTQLDFSGDLPKQTKGKDAPATPIPDAAFKDARDPFTTMLDVLADRPGDTSPCTIDLKSFDGTRIARFHTLTPKETKDSVTCTGAYERLAGYSKEELTEMSTSPAEVRFVRAGKVWRPDRIIVTTRNGTATLSRQADPEG